MNFFCVHIVSSSLFLFVYIINVTVYAVNEIFNVFQYDRNVYVDLLNNFVYNENTERSGYMSVSEQLKILCVKLNISVSELARLFGRSPQAFSQKMKRESFTVDELKKIAEVSDCKYVGTFELPNGEKVEY